MIKQLNKEIENALNRQMQTPKDFEFLRDRIYARLHVLVSRTTLMRFLGYKDWESFKENAMLPKEQQSNPIMSRKLSVSELVWGNRLRLIWQPERVCDIEYLGDLNFRVIASENTRLHVGDTFQCSLIVEGEPLYIDNLKQGDQQLTAYVCGKKSGVYFEFL